MEYIVYFDIQETGYIQIFNLIPIALMLGGYIALHIEWKRSGERNWFKRIPKTLLLFFVTATFISIETLYISINSKLDLLAQYENGEFNVVEGKIENYKLHYSHNNVASFEVNGIKFNVGSGNPYSPPRHYATVFNEKPEVRVTYNKRFDILKFEKAKKLKS